MIRHFRLAIGPIMSFALHPWQLFFIIRAGWVNRQQHEIIAYLRCENQMLREKLGRKRILLNDDQRRRLAVKGKVLGRRLLGEIGTLFTPDRILRWHRMLVAKKWDYSERRKSVGRPRVRQDIVDLVPRFARENITWGYDRIEGTLASSGITIVTRRSCHLVQMRWARLTVCADSENQTQVVPLAAGFD